MIDVQLSKQLLAVQSVNGIVDKVLRRQTLMALFGYAGQCGAIPIKGI